jgi:hypothetical protein
MKRIHVIGLCLVAVFAFSAVASSGASAAQPYLFSRATFTFTSKGGEGKLLTVGKQVVKCVKVTNTGSTENAHLGHVTILFEECVAETIFGNFTCTTSGSITGHITLSSLLFHLGELNENAAIIVLLPTAGISFSCGLAGTITVKGNVVGLLFKLTSDGGGRWKLKEPVKSVNLVFEDNGTTGVQLDKSITLSLGGGTLTNQHLTSTVGGTEEESSQVSTDSLENVNGKNETIELVE